MSLIGAASAPASSANLGPGFDCLALALDLRCRVHAQVAGDWSVSSESEHPGDAAEEFIRSAAAFAGAGPFHIAVESDVPRAAGLGSSAALAAATVAACARAGGTQPSREDVFAAVAELEGHADNAAAAVYGGLVAAVGGRVLRLDLWSGLRVVVAVAERGVATTAARRALPERVDHEVAARNVARAIALVHGLRRGDPEALTAAGGDELHEPYREDLAPHAGAVAAAARRAGALHAALSGAGPAVVALTDIEHRGAVAGAMETALQGSGWVISPAISTSGLE